jgi:hypothetical protein
MSVHVLDNPDCQRINLKKKKTQIGKLACWEWGWFRKDIYDVCLEL